MSNYEIVKTPEFTWKVFRLEEYKDGIGSNKETKFRQFWVATFESSKDANSFVEYKKIYA